jgi:hypothetical protein
MAKPGPRPGRPFTWKTPARLSASIDQYFTNCKESGELPRLTSLHIHLGVWRGYLNELAETRPEFVRVVKKMYERMAEAYERDTGTKKVIPALGIFMLKNCGYTDRIEVTANVSGLSLVDLAREARAEQQRRKDGRRKV